jgi:hypothetical protein
VEYRKLLEEIEAIQDLKHFPFIEKHPDTGQKDQYACSQSEKIQFSDP